MTMSSAQPQMTIVPTNQNGKERPTSEANNDQDKPKQIPEKAAVSSNTMSVMTHNRDDADGAGNATNNDELIKPTNSLLKCTPKLQLSDVVQQKLDEKSRNDPPCRTSNNTDTTTKCSLKSLPFVAELQERIEDLDPMGPREGVFAILVFFLVSLSFGLTYVITMDKLREYSIAEEIANVTKHLAKCERKKASDVMCSTENCLKVKCVTYINS